MKFTYEEGLTVSDMSRDEALKEKLEIEELQDRIRQGQIDVRHTNLSGTVTSAFVTVPSAKQAREILKNVKDDMKRAGYHIQRVCWVLVRFQISLLTTYLGATFS